MFTVLKLKSSSLVSSALDSSRLVIRALDLRVVSTGFAYGKHWIDVLDRLICHRLRFNGNRLRFN